MSRTRVVLLFFALLILAIGAAVVFFAPLFTPAPRVVQIEPSDGAREVRPDSSIVITFSEPMERAQTEQSIRINPRTAGRFFWNDDVTLTWIPRPRLPVSSTVTIDISTDAHSVAGQPLVSETIARFTTLTRPTVLGSSPSLDARFLYIPDQLSLTFSRAMNAEVLSDTLEIDPPLGNRRLQVAENMLILRGDFQPGVRYQIAIPGTVTDAENGIELGTEVGWAFEVGAQYPHFSILNRDRVMSLAAGVPVGVPIQAVNVSRLDVALYRITRRLSMKRGRIFSQHPLPSYLQVW